MLESAVSRKLSEAESLEAKRIKVRMPANDLRWAIGVHGGESASELSVSLIAGL